MAESGHQPPHYCTVETTRLGAVGSQWRLGLPEGAFPLCGEINHRSAQVDGVWRLYGDVLARLFASCSKKE